MYPSHWLYPLYSKMLLCFTYVSQSLVVPSALEDAHVFDVCIPVIGCTLCTRRCSCVWRQSLVVPSALEDTPVFYVCIPEWLGYIRQTQEHLRVQRVQPMTGIHTSNTGASSSVEGTTNDWDTYVKHRSIFEYRGYNQWLGYIRQTHEHLRVQRVQPMTGIHTSNTGAS